MILASTCNGRNLRTLAIIATKLIRDYYKITYNSAHSISMLYTLDFDPILEFYTYFKSKKLYFEMSLIYLL